MRDDLLDAQASLDWAVAQFEILKPRIEAWQETAKESIVRNTKFERGQKIIHLASIEPPPALINAEVGAIINSIRSSLDILIAAVARRHGVPDKNSYFPIANSRDQFLTGGYKGAKVIKALPIAAQTTIERLEPWKGGNPCLIALHELDILRKHKRLISMVPAAWDTEITAAGGDGILLIVLGEQDQPVMIPLGVPPHGKVNFTPHIAISESDFTAESPVLASLSDFASATTDIIKLFDIP